MGNTDAERIAHSVTLVDHEQGEGARSVRVDVIHEGVQQGQGGFQTKCTGLCLKPEGYSTGECDAGIIFLEIHEGRLRLLVWSDIEVLDITHDIDLEKARERQFTTPAETARTATGVHRPGAADLRESPGRTGSHALSRRRGEARDSEPEKRAAGVHQPPAVKNPVWTWLGKIPYSHSWFREEKSGWIAVCDDSGSSPSEADDGILWLDKSRPIIYDESTRTYLGATGVTTPLMRPDGEQTTTISNYGEVEYLVETHRMKLMAKTSAKSGLDPLIPMELRELKAALRG